MAGASILAGGILNGVVTNYSGGNFVDGFSGGIINAGEELNLQFTFK